ncbi:acetylxylan esterase [bacterium]|nr:acetylxylan esterase [bacterium]
MAAVLITSSAAGQIADAPDDSVAGIPVNYTEAEIGDYNLPDPLICRDGQVVDNPEIWSGKRRPEICALFEQVQFGHAPPGPEPIRYQVFDSGTSAFDGKAKRTQVTIYFSKDANEPGMDLLYYIPADAGKPVPVLLYIAFTANSMVVDDPGIRQGFIWNREHKKVPADNGRRFDQLNVPAVLARGFGVATVYYGDIEPDFQEGAALGVRNLLAKPENGSPYAGPWGAIAAWSWGLSRCLDYFERDGDVDAGRVAIMGISRLGKTVLWAGALDPRFALIIPVCSGESGAALSRRNYGETIAHITAPARYHYWFVPGYQEYADKVDLLPVDSHMLLAMLAPRPVLLVTGNTDKWSDPYGEFLAALAAGPVYRLLGKEGLNTDKMPPAGVPVLNDIGFYMHDGGHGLVPSDWDVILDFLVKHLQPEN